LIATPPVQNIAVGSSVSFQIFATDHYADTDTFTAFGMPVGDSISYSGMFNSSANP
jgi:hypothetical protein